MLCQPALIQHIAYTSWAQRSSRWEEDMGDNCTSSSETLESIFIHAVRQCMKFMCSHMQAHRHVSDSEDTTRAPWLLGSLFLHFTHVAAIQPFLHLSHSHKGPRRSQDCDPNFTGSEWMTEICHLLFRSNSASICLQHSIGACVWLSCARMTIEKKVCLSLLCTE